MMHLAENAAPEPAEDRWIYGGVFLVSAAVLLLQIALTRIFSFSLWYHFAYVTISVAMLGYGSSGAFLAVFPGLAGPQPAFRLSRYALACGLSIVGTFLVIATVPFAPFALRAEPATQIPYALLYYAAVTAPFFLAGLCISVALRSLAHQVSRFYFFDLAGAGLGCFAVTFLITAVGTPGVLVVAAVLVCMAGVLFSRGRSGGSPALPAAATAVVAVLGTLAVSSIDVPPSREKFLYSFLADKEKHVGTHWYHWSPIFRTDFFTMKDEEFSRIGSYAGWGVSPHWRHLAPTRAPKIRFMTHDGDAGAVIYNFDGDLSKLELFDNIILKAPYLLLDRPTVLVIGVGGGTDIVNAVFNRAAHVTGIELDPYTVKVVREDQAEFAGRLYDRPDVTVIADEGRSFVRRSDTRYDLIQLTGVDTLAALSTGAYVLSESYLYTVEAIQEFLDRLTPDGLLCIVVGDTTGAHGFPRHTVRQLSLYLAALDARGIGDPGNRIAVIASAEPVPQVAMLLKNGRFTAEETQTLADWADRMGFRPWALPGREFDTVHSRYLRTPAAQRADFLAAIPLNLDATTDNNPFFFHFYQWRHLGHSLDEIDVGHTLATGQIVLAAILLLSVAAALGLILLPLFVFQRQGLHTEGKWGFIAFFVAIGLGFIFIEISFIQKFVLFLGYPTYALTVVLFSLLTYSGIGSYLTGSMRLPPERRLLPLFAGLAAVSLAYLVLLPVLFRTFLGSPFPLRVVLASLALAPLGLLMGMFFPTGIAIVRRTSLNFVPWAWGVNGSASVVGTVLAVVLAMSHGFRTVTVLAVLVYLVGVLGMRAAAARLAAGR